MSALSHSQSNALSTLAPAGARVVPELQGRATNWLRQTYELSESTNRLMPMEGLRGVAVILVFFVHFHAIFGEYGRDWRVLWNVSQFLGLVGNAGVDLFFVLSGYLIYGALVRPTTCLIRFLRRRIERIYPTFVVVFMLYIALSLVFPQASRLHGRTVGDLIMYLIQNLLLLPGVFDITPVITVAWSLSYEVFFYLSAASIIRIGALWVWPQWARMLFFGGIGTAYLGLCFTVLTKSHVRAVMFIVGMLLYEALTSERFRSMLSKFGESAALVALVLSFMLCYLLDIRNDVLSALPALSAGRSSIVGVPGYQGPYKTILLSVSMFWFVAYCFAFDGSLCRALSWNPLRYLGNMSYSYYLVHGITLQAVALLYGLLLGDQAHSPSLFLIALPIGFAATWMSATALFLWVERPLSLQRKMRSQRIAVS